MPFANLFNPEWAEGPDTSLEKYSSIKDIHLVHHFRRPSVFLHLVKMGLVSPEGQLVNEIEWQRRQRFSWAIPTNIHRRVWATLSKEGNIRPRIKIPEDHSSKPIRTRNEESCFRHWSKRLGVDGEPYILNAKDAKSKSRISLSRKLSSTSSLKFWDRLCPVPKDSRIYPTVATNRTVPAGITLQFLGKRGPQHVVILQQVIGLQKAATIFNKTLHPEEVINVGVQRGKDEPFSLLVMIDGLFTDRINACCEYKHKPGFSLGGSKCLKVLAVEGGRRCSRCCDEKISSKPFRKVKLKKDYFSTFTETPSRSSREKTSSIDIDKEVADYFENYTKQNHSSSKSDSIKEKYLEIEGNRRHVTPSRNNIENKQTLKSKEPPYQDQSTCDSNLDDIYSQTFSPVSVDEDLESKSNSEASLIDLTVNERRNSSENSDFNESSDENSPTDIRSLEKPQEMPRIFLKVSNTSIKSTDTADSGDFESSSPEIVETKSSKNNVNETKDGTDSEGVYEYSDESFEEESSIDA